MLANFKLIVASSIYLGCKIEEEHVKLRDIVNVCYNTLHVNKPPLELDETYIKLRNSVITCEFLLARVLGFNFKFNQPHKVMLYRFSLIHFPLAVLTSFFKVYVKLPGILKSMDSIG